MSRIKILFLHGWHSVPGGVKPTYLREHGLEVINPQLDDDDFALAVAKAQAEYDNQQPQVVVGSSRGGAVALNIKSGETPLVLLCPAWKNWGAANYLKPNGVILHSRHDDVIAYEDSEELIERSGLPSESLIEVGGDHRLADPNSLAVMLWACQLLGSGGGLPWIDEEYFAKQGPQVDSQQEGHYICDSCGEEIVVPVDVSEGATQSYVEDCPVCCHPNVIHVGLDQRGKTTIWSEPA